MECKQGNCGCKQELNQRLLKISNHLNNVSEKLDSCSEKLESKGNCWEIITELHQIKHSIQEIKQVLLGNAGEGECNE